MFLEYSHSLLHKQQLTTVTAPISHPCAGSTREFVGSSNPPAPDVRENGPHMLYIVGLYSGLEEGLRVVSQQSSNHAVHAFRAMSRGYKCESWRAVTRWSHDCV